ncbi:hypothetical protein N5T66_11145 [Aliarcobacter cryaerophilus]|uniref:hypothetical protein n=1 Tax=Aliarcobacter cryaerophilus TaxID=28198 RepID=UPI0021B2CF7B|nr:hypothetical protein [Aliarcobacter cryaerophilus]MCT7433840.1 hypothetical protein [Aliarcobacter cryaerophilus]
MRFYEDDKLTGLKIKDSFYEEWKDLINRILFWTILFAPYMFVINDIYQNKLMHDNNFWIKRAKLYFAFLVVTYLIMSLTLQARIDYMIALNLFLTYLMLFGILKAQEYYGHLLKGNCEEYKPSKEEIENIIKVQASDENEENVSKKIKIRIVSFIFGVLIYSITLNTFPEISGFVICFFIIVYDVLEQKYFKRDLTNSTFAHKKSLISYM